MTKDQVYKTVMDTVTKVTEPREDWMTSRDEESVMTRALIVHALFKIGFSRSQISSMTGLKKNAVVDHLNKWDSRLKYSSLLVAWSMKIDRSLNGIDFFGQ